MQVSPALAKEWLGSARINRPLRARRVQQYAHDMAAGRWMETGEAISFSISGALLNGQHRLHACIEADTPFWSLVVWGLPDEAFDAMDAGLPRSTGDVLGLRGAVNKNALAASGRLAYKYRNGTLRMPVEVSRQDILEFVENHPLLQECVNVAAKGQRGLLPPSYAGWLLFEFASRLPEEAFDFYGRMTDIAGDLGFDTPEHVLRTRLVRDRLSTSKLPELVKAAYTVQAWNARVTGTGRSLLRWTLKEEFPRIEPGMPEKEEQTNG